MGADWLGAITEFVSAPWQVDRASDMADHAMNMSSAEAATNRDFQERMRATQYQTATKDMQAAGLNPMLAYQQGGAGTPGGSTGSGFSASVEKPRIAEAMQTAAQIDNIKAQTRKTNADAAVTEDMVASDDPAKPPRTFQGREMQYKVEQAWYDAKRKVGEVDLTNEQINHVKQQIANAITRNELDKLDIPKAINEAAAQGSWYMKHVAPYTGEAGKLIGSAAQLAGAKRGFDMNRYIIHGK